MKRIGRTTGGHPVVAGLYAEHKTVGTPLDMLLEWVVSNGQVPSFPHLLSEMVASGMSPERAAAKLKEAVVDGLGKRWADVVNPRLDVLASRPELLP